MFRKLHNISAVICAISTLLLPSCSSDEPENRTAELAVTIEARGPRAEEGTGSLHDDLTLYEGIVLIYNKDGIFEAAEKFDPAKKMATLRMTDGQKRIVALANPPKALRDLIATDCHEPILDEFGNPKTYMGDTLYRNLKPVHNLYSDLVATLSLSADYCKSVQNSRRMLLIHDKDVTISTEDGKSSYVEIPLVSPMARIDLHARCLPKEKERVADAAIRVSYISPSLNWDMTQPSVVGDIVTKFTDVSDRMTAVTTEDELFDDKHWETTVVKETDPLATLYTYYSDVNARLEVGLRFKGSADYDWFPIDLKELLDEYKGLEKGHLYQIFITVYPDKVGHIIVDPWIVPGNLEFTIG